MPTIDIQVSADIDDAFTKDGVLTTGFTYLFTNESGAETALFTGWRFINVLLPAGATIDVAYISLRQYSTLDDPSFDVHAELSRTPTAIETGTLIDNRDRTTNKTYWTASNMTAGQWYNSPSIVDVIQELIDDVPGWTSGDDLCIIGKQVYNGLRGGFYDYQFSTGTSGGKLHIEYTEGVPAATSSRLQVI